MNYLIDYPHLCTECNNTIASLALAMPEMPDSIASDPEAPANYAYDNALFCGGRTCAEQEEEEEGDRKCSMVLNRPDAELMKYVVNMGIDSRLTAVVNSQFWVAGGKLQCRIDPRDLAVIMVRLDDLFFLDGKQEAGDFLDTLHAVMDIEDVCYQEKADGAIWIEYHDGGTTQYKPLTGDLVWELWNEKED